MTTVPRIGDKAPNFKCEALMPDNTFKEISLEDYKDKWVVLYFYPLDFTFVCPTEIIAFDDHVKQFEEINTAVIGASVDSKFTHFAWVQTPRKEGGLGEIHHPLLADLNREVANLYGCMHQHSGHTLRATFIIDPNGVLRHFSFNDPPVGRNVGEVLRLVKAFQFHDKHGEVCPATWTKEGDATIKTDPIKKLEFFNKA